MSKKIFGLVVTGVFTLFLSWSAFGALAQPKGVYVEGNIGYGKVKIKVPNLSTKNTGIAGNLNAGYKFNENFAVEGGAGLFSKVKAAGAKAYTGNYYFDIAARGIIPLNNGVNLFAKAGLAVVHTDIKNWLANNGNYTKPTVLLGGGISYYINSHVGVSISGLYLNKVKRVPVMYAGTLGLIYIF